MATDDAAKESVIYKVSPRNGQPVPPPEVRGPGTKITKENAAEMGRRGGQALREKYNLKRTLLRELEKKIIDPDTGQKLTQYERLAMAAIEMARKNPKFWELVRDTIGEKPVENMKLVHDMEEGAVIHIGYDDD